MEKTYCIPVPRFWELEEKIGKVNKRAAKLGLPAVTYTVLDSENRPAGLDDFGRAMFIQWHTVTVVGVTPKFAGWTFAGTLDPLDGGNSIRKVPGTPETPVQYRTTKPVCDHCNLNRRRNETFLVYNEEGEWKQLGRQCIADFLGGADPHAIAAALEYLLELDEFASDDGDDDGFGGGGGYVARTSVFSLLTWSAAAIRQFGWMSRTEARDSYVPKIATADQINNFWEARTAQEREDWHIDAPNDDDKLLAFATIQHWNADSAENDYTHNLKLVLNQGTVEPKQYGIAVSAVASYQRFLGKMAERKATESRKATVSEHLGTIGERRVFQDLEVIGNLAKEGQYGVTTILRFLDPQGQALTWFASGYKDEEFKLGTIVTLLATIKKHDEYLGQKQTILTRASVVVAGAKAPKTRKAKAAA
jgi:hypothetical protein